MISNREIGKIFDTMLYDEENDKIIKNEHRIQHEIDNDIDEERIMKLKSQLNVCKEMRKQLQKKYNMHTRNCVLL